MKTKTIYLKPKADVYAVSLECGITASSAYVQTGNEDLEIYEQWIDDEDVIKTIDW